MIPQNRLCEVSYGFLEFPEATERASTHGNSARVSICFGLDIDRPAFGIVVSGTACWWFLGLTPTHRVFEVMSDDYVLP